MSALSPFSAHGGAPASASAAISETGLPGAREDWYSPVRAISRPHQATRYASESAP